MSIRTSVSDGYRKRCERVIQTSIRRYLDRGIERMLAYDLTRIQLYPLVRFESFFSAALAASSNDALKPTPEYNAWLSQPSAQARLR